MNLAAKDFKLAMDVLDLQSATEWFVVKLVKRADGVTSADLNEMRSKLFDASGIWPTVTLEDPPDDAIPGLGVRSHVSWT